MLQFIRKRMLNAYFALPMLVCMALTTFSSMGRTTSTKKVNFSGEEVFRGVFFADGKYAELIPEIQHLKLAYQRQVMGNQTLSKVKIYQDYYVKKIVETNPNIFTDFENTVRQGDKQKIRSLIVSTGLLLKSFSPYQKHQSNSENGTLLLVANIAYIVDVIAILVDSAIFGDSEELTTSNTSNSALLLDQISQSVSKTSQLVGK